MAESVPQCHEFPRVRAKTVGSLGSSDDESVPASRPRRAGDPRALPKALIKAAVLGKGRVSHSIRAEKGVIDGRFDSPPSMQVANSLWALVSRRQPPEGRGGANNVRPQPDPSLRHY
jgi:hypothetical protein